MQLQAWIHSLLTTWTSCGRTLQETQMALALQHPSKQRQISGALPRLPEETLELWAKSALDMASCWGVLQEP